MDTNKENDKDYENDIDRIVNRYYNNTRDDVKELFKELKIEDKKENNNTSSNNDDYVRKDDEIVLGIDLGTSNSCCAVWMNGNVEIVRDEYNNRTIPSVIALTQVNRYIGHEAKNQIEINAPNTIYEVKRLIGKKITDEEIQDNIPYISYEITGDENDNVMIKTQIGKSYTPEELLSMILSRIKIMAEEYLKKEITKAVISIPANFNDIQRESVKNASRICGLDLIRIINEPTAAALAYGLLGRSLNRVDDDINVVVYDYGGGTLDVSLLNISNGIFEVLGSSGNSRLGGSDFDKRIMKYCIEYFKKKNKIQNIDKLSVLTMQKLRKIAENSKKILSTSLKTTVCIREFYNGIDLYVPLTQKKMLDICDDLLVMSLEPLEELLCTNGIQKENINEIIMVGGMTKMPIIRENIKKFMNGKEPNCSINPDEVVASGAAIQGYMLVNSDDPFSKAIKLFDVAQLSIGVEILGGVMSTIIKRNTLIPCTRKKMYTTDSDDVKSVSIKIYEGERKMTKDNYFVGEFILDGVEELPRGTPEIEVSFSIDCNGIITVTAEDKNTYNKNSITVTGNKGRLTNDDINRMVREAKEYELKDKTHRQKKHLYYEIDDMVGTIVVNIKREDSGLNDDDKQKILDHMEKIKKWLKEKMYLEREVEEYKSTIELLKNKYQILLIKINLKVDDGDMKGLQKEEKNATTVYDDDDEDDLVDNIFKKVEEDEMGLTEFTDKEKEEIKSVKSVLIELCDSLFEILASEQMNISDQDAYDLKNYIDDSLLWSHINHKSTVEDYRSRIDLINAKTNEILDKYGENENIFKENDIVKNIKTSYGELEYLVYFMRSMIDNNHFSFIEDCKLKILIDAVNDSIKWIENPDMEEEHKDEEMIRMRIDNINTLSNDMYQEIEKIKNKSTCAVVLDDDDDEGLSIQKIKEMKKAKETK